MTAPSASLGPVPRTVPARPPKSRRRARRQALAVSSVCLLAGTIVFITGFALELDQYGDTGIDAISAFLSIDLVVGLAAGIAVGPIRRSLVGNALLVVAGVLSAFALPAWLVAVVRLAARRSLLIDAAVVTVTVVGAIGMSLWRDAVAQTRPDPATLAAVAAGAAALTVAALLWGRVRAGRAELVVALRAQAEAAEVARAALAGSRAAEIARVRAEERSALARDMHDGISHQLSIAAIHAGALASRDDLTPAEIRSAAQTIRDATALAGSLLRESLTALRATPGTDLDATPLPSSGSIDLLCAEARKRGQQVTLTWRQFDADQLGRHGAVAVALARTTREILVNAGKHAPDQRLDMVIARTAGSVTLTAGNALPEHPPRYVSGTGHGLVGVAERAALLGGEARYGVAGDGRFTVEVRIPCP